MFNDFIVNKLYSINCLVSTHILLKNLFFFDSQYPFRNSNEQIIRFISLFHLPLNFQYC